MTDPDYEAILEDMIASGDAEVVGTSPDGERRYRLTPQGIEKARAIYVRLGMDPDVPDPDAAELRTLLTRLDAEEQAGTS